MPGEGDLVWALNGALAAGERDELVDITIEAEPDDDEEPSEPAR